MKILIIGCGSIGTRHIKNLISINAGEIIACDTNSKQLQKTRDEFNIKTYDNVDEAFNEKYDLIFVCTPPSLHIQLAMKAIENKSHVFIEKPISHTIDDVEKLLNLAKESNLLVFVGYNHRFFEGIKILKKLFDQGTIGKPLSVKAEFGQYLPYWHPDQDYRQSYTAQNKLGGGIILDASHEIDYVRWIIGEIREVKCQADKISDLEVDVEDTADISVKFEGNVKGEIHMDFIQKDYTRNCKIIGEKGSIFLDYPKKTVELKKENNEIITYPIESEVGNSYIQEIKHVIDCVKTKKKPLIDGDSAKRVLEIALAAKESARTGEVKKL